MFFEDFTAIGFPTKTGFKYNLRSFLGAQLDSGLLCCKQAVTCIVCNTLDYRNKAPIDGHILLSFF